MEKKISYLLVTIRKIKNVLGLIRSSSYLRLKIKGIPKQKMIRFSNQVNITVNISLKADGEVITLSKFKEEKIKDEII